MSHTDLILDLALDQLDQPSGVDASPHRLTPRALGRPQTFAGGHLGAAVHLDGASGVAVTLAALPPAPPQLTVSVWVNVQGLEPGNGVTLLTLGDPHAGALVWTLEAAPAQGATLSLATVPGGQGITLPLPLNVWRHLALVRQGDHFTGYVDGRAVDSFSAPGFTLSGSELRLGLPQDPRPGAAAPAGLLGEMARARVQTTALSAAALTDLIAADRTPRAALDEAVPLNLRLLDASGAPNLAITDHSEGEILTLEVQNVSSYPVHLSGRQSAASTLTLTFPPGALHPTLYRGTRWSVALLERDLWTIMPPVRHPDGTVGLALVPRVRRLDLAPGEVHTITLGRVRAEPGEGTRPCRTLFSYTGLASDNPALGDEQSAERAKLLQIVNRSGSRFLPLEAGVAGAPRLLTGAQEASLELRLTNTSTDRILLFEPPAADEGGQPVPVSALIVELPAGDGPQDLLQAGSATTIGAEMDGWTPVQEGVDGPRPRLVLHPDQEVRLPGGEALTLRLTGLVVSPIAGAARLRVIHRGLPGFRYGAQSVTVEKSPLVFDEQGQVGIRTTPGDALAVRGRASAPGAELIGLLDARGSRRWRINYRDGSGDSVAGLNFVEAGVADYRFFLAHGGRVGIGTGNPRGQLHVAADPGRATYLRLTSHVSPIAGGETHCAITLQADDGKEAMMSANTGSMAVTTELDRIYLGAAVQGELYLNRNNRIDTRLQWHDKGVSIERELTVNGRFSATSKFFSIDHPLRPGERLVHGSLEGPEAGVYYRGEGVLVDGTATVVLPAYFEALTRPQGRTVHLTAKGREPFLLSYEDVTEGRFTVHGTKADGAFSWEVRAIRADVPPLEVEPGEGGPP